MAASLILSNNQASNPLSLDLSSYLRLQPDQGTDPAPATFSTKIFTRSILKEGATLALEQLSEREMVFPLALKGTSGPAVAGTLVQQINQVLTTPGATASWQDDGMSQPTVFDLLSGALEIEYSYHRSKGGNWTNAKLRLFAQPLGRKAGPRLFATASGVGPLLMISPYASSGAVAVGASTQAGTAGFGGQQQGASSGVFYWGAPSLAGDAPAQLQISYVGPLPKGASNAGQIPYVAVSLLPDASYRPLVTTQQVTSSLAQTVTSSTAVGSQYLTLSGQANVDSFTFSPWGSQVPTGLWSGPQRLLAIARASGAAGALVQQSNELARTSFSATVNPGDWGLYDVGTFSYRPSELPLQPVTVSVQPPAVVAGAVDVCAFVVLPDSKTWWLNPTVISASQYGVPSGVAAQALLNQAWIKGASNPQGVAVDASFVYWANQNAKSIARANLGGTSPSQLWITGASSPQGVAVDGSFVYWANNANNSIARANLDGSSPSQAWITGASSPQGVAVDSNYVYWANQNANSIGRANVGPNPNQSWITGASSPEGVAVDGSFVYWANTTGNTIGRANLDGTSPSESWITGANVPVGVAVDASFVYWSNTNSIGRANLNGTSPSQTWITGASGANAVTADSSFVYWSNQNANAIARANLNGTSPSQTWITGASNPVGVAVDASFVYWSNGTPNSIGRANLNGTSPSQSWITGITNLYGIAVDANHVYWADEAPSNTIGRANLDGTSPSESWITGANVPVGVAVDGTFVYWSNFNSKSIGRANVGTSASQTWIKGASSPQGVAVDGSFVYWANQNANSIARANLDGTSPNQKWITSASSPQGVAVDSSHVYWANQSTGPNSIGRANLDGTSPNRSWITGASAPEGVAVDANFVYWANSSGNTIGRTPVTTTTKAAEIAAIAPYTNTIYLDDLLPDQFIYSGASQTSAPSPVGLSASSAPITAYSRGLTPRPDPNSSLPILAILGVGQNSTPSTPGQFGQAGASWANPQNVRTMAQVNVVERTRYVLP